MSYSRNGGLFIKKGFSKLYGLGNPKVKGDFAGIKDAVINIWPTPISNVVWKVHLIVRCDFKFLVKLFSTKYMLNNSGINNPNNNENLFFTALGGTIKLSKGYSENIIQYIDTNTKELYSRELKQKNEQRIKQKKLEIENQIKLGIDDI